jgi:hypothetical protein
MWDSGKQPIRIANVIVHVVVEVADVGKNLG